MNVKNCALYDFNLLVFEDVKGSVFNCNNYGYDCSGSLKSPIFGGKIVNKKNSSVHIISAVTDILKRPSLLIRRQ